VAPYTIQRWPALRSTFAVLKVLDRGEQQRLLLAEHDHVLDRRLESLARIEEERALALAQLLLAKSCCTPLDDRVADARSTGAT
jgi:hypothetical protein